MANLCAPAVIFILFTMIQIILDTFLGLFNTAVTKFFIGIIITVLLIALCESGFTVLSWIILFIPIIMMSTVVTIILYTFGWNSVQNINTSYTTNPYRINDSIIPYNYLTQYGSLTGSSVTDIGSKIIGLGSGSSLAGSSILGSGSGPGSGLGSGSVPSIMGSGSGSGPSIMGSGSGSRLGSGSGSGSRLGSGSGSGSGSRLGSGSGSGSGPR
jgi:hypothetical protein